MRTLGRAAAWRNASDWIWPLVAGHHGRVPAVAAVVPPTLTPDHGNGRWAHVRAHLVDMVADAVGFRPGPAVPRGRPSRGIQLAALGYIVMADWIASNQDAFPPISSGAGVGMDHARDRAAAGWSALALGTGWQADRTPPADLVEARFGVSARPLQEMAVRAAIGMDGPGLMIVEAPMGEGKTEAALAAAEVLARRFGARGLFVGMPTQATSDPMFDRVHRWSLDAARGIGVALLHGKRMFNPAWRALLARADVCGDEHHSAPAVSDWFLGRKRGLLAPLAIGTIDNLLLAGARTRHVMLRHAGLAEKVVILDEVHAASAYMAQYLAEALRWLGSSRAPVVLLTATLPPALRTQLAAAYLEGAFEATGEAEPAAAARQAAGALAALPGYPGMATVWVTERGPSSWVGAAAPWRPSLRVRVEVADDLDDNGEAIGTLLADALVDGGCALVIRNTVDSAQRTYATLRRRFDEDVVLLHARLLAGERAARTARELGRLGPGAGADRPRRRVLVATQVAEQSFDVDADVLVTDIAPIDLLLQRAGRLHRHARASRPPRLSAPRLVVTGLRTRPDRPPTFGRGSLAIYREHRLLRAAALVLAALDDGWDLPREVPSLVAEGYGAESVGPSEWAEDATRAAIAEAAWKRDLEAVASQGLLSPTGAFATPTLAGLHRLERPGDEDDSVAIEGIVREGEQSAEVVLVRADADGDLFTLGGRRLTRGERLEAAEEAVEEALASLLRLPALPDVTAAARALDPPAAWSADPLLRGLRGVPVDGDGRLSLAGRSFRYDPELGLVAGSTNSHLSAEASR